MIPAPIDGPSDGLVLAVDGGSSKTDLALLESSGRLRSVVRGPGCNAHYLGIEGCVEVLERLLETAAEEADIAPAGRPLASTAQILIAGADLPEDRASLQSAMEQLGWSEQLVVDTDMPALLRAGTARGWGVAVVCGAGINCLGVAPDGREARFLALGPISGDWGGGADVGRAAVAAATRSADGRGPHTILESAVPAHFGLAGALEVSRALHLRQIPEARLGELAQIVFAVSGQDSVAAAIVSRLADEVVAFARAALRRLELTESDPEVVLGGSLLRALSPSVVETMTAGVREVAPRAHVLVSASEPIVGAALLGLDALGADASAGDRARTELGDAVSGVSADNPMRRA